MADHDIHIVIAQLNFTVGDIENNTKKIIEAIKKVNDDNNADVIVYTNEIEDPGSKSIYINNPDAVETTIADQNELTEFNNDVKRKYVSTTVYDENINLLKALEKSNSGVLNKKCLLN